MTYVIKKVSFNYRINNGYCNIMVTASIGNPMVGNVTLCSDPVFFLIYLVH
jgi:hypothetical protein